MLTVVLKATRGNPQVRSGASLETGSYPKDSRRHGQPAPIVAGRAYPRRPISPPGRKPRHGAAATRARQRPASCTDSQACATAAAIELRRSFRAGVDLRVPSSEAVSGVRG